MQLVRSNLFIKQYVKLIWGCLCLHLFS